MCCGIQNLTWLSISNKSQYRDTDSPPAAVYTGLYGVRGQRLQVTHSAAGGRRRCQRWRRCVAACLCDASLYRLRPPLQSRLAAICTGWRSHRTDRSRSDKQKDEAGFNVVSIKMLCRVFSLSDWTVCVTTNTDINHPHAVSPPQVEEDRGFVQVSQHGHVLHHVELRRVHWLEVVFFHYQKLKHTQVLSHVVWPSEICTCPQYHNWSKKTLNYSFWILEYRYRPHKSIIDRAAMRKMSVSLSVKKAKVENLQDLKTFIFYTKIVNKLLFFSNESFDMNWVMNQPVRLWSPRWSCLRSALWPPPLCTLHYHQASRLSSSLRESDQNVSQSVLSWHVGEGKRLFKSLFRWQFLCLTVNTSLSS